MVNNVSEDDPGHGLACGARSFDCFSYVDPTNYERVGVKLVLQACICPAAVLAANVSLLDGEDEPTHAHGIPCADTFAIGPRGLEEYRRMCRSQLACGFMCMGLPVIYTENLIQRQRIRSKYGLRDPTSLSEIGAGCCYPCSIFQSHTFLYVSTHRPSKPRPGVHASHGPLSGALRAMHRATSTSKQRSQDVASTVRQETHTAGASASCPKPIEPPRVSLHHSCTTPEKRPRQEATATAATAASGIQEAPAASAGGCTASTSLTAAAAASAAAQRVPSASCIASGFGETPDLMVTSPRHEAQTNTRRAAHRIPAASPASAESRSTPASSSIPPPEVTDSPPVGAAMIASTPEVEDDDGDEVSSALTDSASMPIPSALPVCTMALSAAKFEFSPPQRPQTSVNLMAIEGPKQSQHMSQTRQRHEACRLQALEPAISAGQPPVKPPAMETVASGMSASDVSLFSLALEPGMPSLPQPASTGAPTPSSGATTASSAAVRAGPGPAPTPLPAPPLPTPGSSRDLHPAAYDTITSSKLSSMIDHAMLNGSGSATGRGSGSAAGGGGTALSSIDPAGPWDIYRHSVMAPIAEGDAEEGQRSIGKVAVHLPVSQDEAYATPDSDAPGSVASASAQRMSPTKSRTFPRHVKVPGSSAEPSPPGSSSLRSARGGRRGSGGAFGTNPFTDPVCAGGAALTALARMGPEGGSQGCGAASSGAGRLGNGLSSRKLRLHGAPPAPRPSPPPRAATLQLERAASTDGVRSSYQRVTYPDGADEDDDNLEDMSASADNFSLTNALPSQLLLNGAVGQLPQRRGSSQGRYGGVAPERPVMAIAAAGVAPLPAKQRHVATGLVVRDDDDDEVNFASIRPSFIDGPEMANLKLVLRAAGEQSADGSEAVSVAPTGPPPPAGHVMMPSSGSQRVVALSTTVTALQQRGSGSRRYSNVPPAVPSSSSTALGRGAVTDAAPYASYCGDATSPEGITARDSVDEDASSIIDGPVSSDEGGSVLVAGPSGAAAAAAATRAPRADPDDDPSAAGDASVSVAVAETRHVGGTPGDLAESTARSASGLSNGESNVGYESVADSVCASQHRQKHWVNWMAQSVGMSMVTSVANSSRAVFTGYGRSAGGPMGKACVPEPASSNLSVNQRIPRPVVEESSNGLYRQWG
ncbi:hypothetical protein VaNZ11_000744 [Volvox africanus]|uniref:Uncharacterized protein n=1 Tax=Volvox africanus TaxID=51714 RepID=A0ABQ5RN25_9CHLO|nr:hypothetical protein VaNZ11_000744 [Volvox africanus]